MNLKKKGQMYGLKNPQRNFCPQEQSARNAAALNSKKKKIYWMSGLIQAQVLPAFWRKGITSRCLLTSILKEAISIEAGSTHRFLHQSAQEAWRLTRLCLPTVLLWTGPAER